MEAEGFEEGEGIGRNECAGTHGHKLGGFIKEESTSPGVGRLVGYLSVTNATIPWKSW